MKCCKKELEFGFTLVGPHKDEMEILVNGKEARYFASEGQKRSLAAALRFAEWAKIAASSEEKPLMMVDDLSLSLDAGRQVRLAEQLESMGQAYFSATSAPAGFSREIKYFKLFVDQHI